MGRSVETINSAAFCIYLDSPAPDYDRVEDLKKAIDYLDDRLEHYCSSASKHGHIIEAISDKLDALREEYAAENWDDYQYHDAWQWFTEDISSALIGRFPSLSEPCGDKWAAYPYRENKLLLHNDHCEVYISEYCGLTAISFVPVDDDYYNQHNNLHKHWCDQIEASARELFNQQYSPVCTASNGETFYEKV